MIRPQVLDAIRTVRKARDVRALLHLWDIGEKLTAEEKELVIEKMPINVGAKSKRVDGFTPRVHTLAAAYARYVEIAGEDLGANGEARAIVAREFKFKNLNREEINREDSKLIDVLTWGRPDVNPLLIKLGFARPKRRASQRNVSLTRAARAEAAL